MNLHSIKITLGSFIVFFIFGFSSFISKNYQKTNFTTTNFLQDTTKKDSTSIPLPQNSISRDSQEVDQFFINVETPAIYPDGGMDGFYNYIQKNLVYPKEAKKKKIEGRVFVQFIVDKEGKITDVQTVKGIGGGCDEEAERLLRESKNWIPAKQRGKTVKVRMNIPIVFKR